MLDFMVWLLGDFVLGLSENLSFFQLESRILNFVQDSASWLYKGASLFTNTHLKQRWNEKLGIY